MATNAANIRVALNSKEAEDNAKKLGQSIFGSLTPVVDVGALAGKALSAVGSVISSMIGFAKEAVTSAGEAEQAELRLVSALEARGLASKRLVDELKEFNSAELQRLGTSDDALIDLQAQLVAQGVHTSRLKEATLATIGLSEATGKDLLGSSKDIARLFVGELSPAIKRIAGDVKTSDQALAELSKQTKLAEDRTQTLTGQLGLLSENYGNVIEAIGASVTESETAKIAVQGLNKILLDLEQFFSGDEGKRAINEFFATMVQGAQLATSLVAVLLRSLEAFGSKTATVIGKQVKDAITQIELTRIRIREALRPDEGPRAEPGPFELVTGGTEAADRRKADVAIGRAKLAKKAPADLERDTSDAAKEILAAGNAESAAIEAVHAERIRLEDEHTRLLQDAAVQRRAFALEMMLAEREAVDERNALKMDELARLFDVHAREINTLRDAQRERERIADSQILNEQQKQERLAALRVQEERIRTQQLTDTQRLFGRDGPFAQFEKAGGELQVSLANGFGQAFGQATAAAIAGGADFGSALKQAMGGMLITLGSSMIATGLAAIALNLLSFIPFFGSLFGAPGMSALAGAAAMAGGVALIGAGAALGGGARPSSPSIGGSAGPRGFAGGGGSTSINDFNRAPSLPAFGNNQQAPVTVVVQGGWFLNDRQAERTLADAVQRGMSGRMT